MASACMQLCSCLLRLKTTRIALQYSSRAQKCPVASSGVPVMSSILHSAHTSSLTRPSSRLRLHRRSYSSTNTHTSLTKDIEAQPELSAGEVVPYKNPLSQQLRDGMTLTEVQQISLDLDAAPRLSPLDEISDEEALRLEVPSALPPASFSLRDYVDESETLSKLVQLGVNIWRLEQRPNVGSMLLKLDFHTDVAPRLVFLKEIGVEDFRLGHIVSHNPFILTESLENLRARVAFLRSKKFSSEDVASMVSRAPYLLNFSVQRLDNRLGFYQKQLGLSTQKTRDLVGRLPRLLCGSLEPVKENLKVFQLELGFRENEIQHIVVTIPKVLTANKKKLTQIFDYVHNTMNVPQSLIVKFPQVLNSKYLRIKERHLFLQYLKKAQYDPALPNYISLDRLVSLPDQDFCTELASATLEDFELFLKTL
ncbi:transcription termination factor 3, mitochondrial isoform X1 [Osmerus eperlanus]|uniref:transcription termination factor 3, mitochondrial isoform X1 n=1 Tax=Osmerus eperlanus TaxID=29151 RepID=UPI002E15749F